MAEKTRTPPAPQRNAVSDLRGLSRLAVAATKGVTDLVEAMHHTVLRAPLPFGQAPLEKAAGPIAAIAGLAFGGVRGMTSLVGASIDVALAQLEPLLAGTGTLRETEGVRAALNGVLGDYLASTHNPLAIPLCLRRDGRPLRLEQEALRAALPRATGKVLVLVHGSAASDLQWTRAGHDHGAALERGLGYTAVYLHYNSGLHVSTNGRAFAEALEQALLAWPVPLEELAIVAHSMGGLVARSALHAAPALGHAWPARLHKLVFLGTPHHGAPLERGGNWVDALLGVSPYTAPFARLGKLRSAGITDLRFGSVLDEDWAGRDRFALGRDPRRPVPLPEGVACFAVAASLDPQTAAGRRGDGLVPLDSALGRHARPELCLAFPEAHQRVFYGLGHLDLLCRADVYEQLARWL